MGVLDRRSALGLGLAAATRLALPNFVAAQTSGAEAGEWEIQLSIYRDLSNRNAGESDEGPMAWDAHKRRRNAVHEILSDPAYDVQSWGETDDEVRPHELVKIIVTVSRRIGPTLVSGFIEYVITDTLKDAVKDEIKDAIKATGELLSKLYSAMKAKQIGDFWLELPDGSRIQVDLNGGIAVDWVNGKIESYPPGWKPTPSP
jgi:hypothetical protein